MGEPHVPRRGAWQLGMQCCRQCVPGAEAQGAVSPRGRRTREGGGEPRVKMRASSQAVLDLSFCTPVSWRDLGNHAPLLPRFLHLQKGFGIAPSQGCW